MTCLSLTCISLTCLSMICPSMTYLSMTCPSMTCLSLQSMTMLCLSRAYLSQLCIQAKYLPGMFVSNVSLSLQCMFASIMIIVIAYAKCLCSVHHTLTIFTMLIYSTLFMADMSLVSKLNQLHAICHIFMPFP